MELVVVLPWAPATVTARFAFISRARMSLRCTMRSPCLMRGDDFRIVRLDGAGEHDGVLAFDVLRLLAEFDGDAEALQTVGFGAWLTVRTIDLDTLLMQHFSEHAHACATNADEMRGT